MAHEAQAAAHAGSEGAGGDPIERGIGRTDLLLARKTKAFENLVPFPLGHPVRDISVHRLIEIVLDPDQTPLQLRLAACQAVVKVVKPMFVHLKTPWRWRREGRQRSR